MSINPQVEREVPVNSDITIDMLDRDPAAVYKRLRQDTPVVRIGAINRIVLTKADDVYLAKTDTRHFHSSDEKTAMQRAFGGHTLMRKDGAAHIREREAMTATFHARHMCATWQAMFQSIAVSIVSSLPAEGSVDLFHHLAAPLSALYLQKVLGIEPNSKDQLFEWAGALITGAMNAGFDPAVFATSDHANAEMNLCMDRMIEHHQEHPNPSVLSIMANAPEPLSLSQIRTNMKICIGGAVIESRDAILTTILGLLQNPDQLRYCIESGRWDLACEEGLRWCAPIQASPRIVARDMALRGVTLPAGETVMVIQGSANYDEDYWQDPHVFDIGRQPIANHTFGAGTHRCLGADMYRLLVSKALLPLLFDRFPCMTVDSTQPVEFRGFVFRGPTSLAVRLNETE
ncbi:cytochrome P450 [Sulfitobacter sp. F26204]|uniref:cytochrome P450 n=1 Tax=Sulfitobacter sp. F26204 TaxID=2996014 RepID=UPI00225E374C|nr:cytochrome P450 [Sulfitobacter sp. F26204]MCX7560692.1 cytochrome P450 [Sulfitobacter sp. F26204]